ncbi:hypothetical protein [Actinomadura sp. 3N407]|uniref:hypothetical protein n=1 Tax=Actinomadura sp. 3N407 TaxID=3457423 RepID=UPI003FCDBCDE
MDKGRLVVGADLRLAGHPDVFALGDAAAVPDLERGNGAGCGPTAQHATRQARTAARNVVASLDGRDLGVYRHRDLGLVVDPGGGRVVARPFGVDRSACPPRSSPAGTGWSTPGPAASPTSGTASTPARGRGAGSAR